jgi:hypothetical protein
LSLLVFEGASIPLAAWSKNDRPDVREQVSLIHEPFNHTLLAS